MLDPRTEIPSNHFHSFNPPGEDSHDSCGSWETMNFGARAPKTSLNYENYKSWNGGNVQFRAETMEDESGICSPPLWKTSPPRSPVHTRYPHNNYRYLSPNSRAQAIARGQWELMEIVKSMPESCYELSLRDIVEHPRRLEAQEEEKHVGRQRVNQRKVIKRQNSKSIDNGGLLLKMAFPFSLGGKKKQNLETNTFLSVLSKPEASEKSLKGDKEWWKKRFSASSESESGGVSSHSGSTGSSGSGSGSRNSSCSNSRKGSGNSTGCWSSLSRKTKKYAM